MTKYFYDTEFIEDGKTIDLISIGIVADDGREYYAVSSTMPLERIKEHQWLMASVWPYLPLVYGHGSRPGTGHLDLASTLVKPEWVIRNEVRSFLLAPSKDVSEPELWAYYSAYDHVVLAQMWGPMINLPHGIPMFTNDIKTLAMLSKVDGLPVQKGTAHNALDDARHVKEMHDHILNAKAEN